MGRGGPSGYNFPLFFVYPVDMPGVQVIMLCVQVIMLCVHAVCDTTGDHAVCTCCL